MLETKSWNSTEKTANRIGIAHGLRNPWEVKDPPLLVPSQQALPTLDEHTGIEAWIIPFQLRQIFPIQASTHDISCLPIREVLSKLRHAHQGESPRSFGGLPLLGIHVGNILIGRDSSQRIAQAQRAIPFRVGRACLFTDEHFCRCGHVSSSKSAPERGPCFVSQ